MVHEFIYGRAVDESEYQYYLPDSGYDCAEIMVLHSIAFIILKLLSSLQSVGRGLLQSLQWMILSVCPSQP